MATFGWVPMPWQREALEVAFEVDSFGQLWYRDITIVVPRQSGKTTIVLPWGVHRMIGWPERQRVVYIAQTASDGKEKLTVDFLPALEKSPLRKLLIPNRLGQLAHLANGSVHLKWANGSRWDVKPPTEKAGHGGTLHLSIGDEIFSVKDTRLEAALKPATITVDDRQSLWISTAGDTKLKSPFLWSKVERGRRRVELVRADPSELDRSRSMFIEYSAPHDADVLDPVTWWSTMPALGFTQTIESVRSIFSDEEMTEREIRRAFFCQWGEDLSTDWKIPRDNWDARKDPESQIGETLIWVPDVSPDRAWASISVASVREDGRVHLETVDDGPGTDWLIGGDDRAEDDVARLHGLEHLVREYGGEVWYDFLTVGSFATDMRDAGIEAQPVETRDVMVAAPMLLDWVLNDRVRHLGQSELDDALAGAATKTFGDGWKWSRGNSMRPITALVSVSLALRMLAKRLPDLNYDPLASLRETVTHTQAVAPPYSWRCSCGQLSVGTAEDPALYADHLRHIERETP
jgi:hypothetical protein